MTGESSVDLGISCGSGWTALRAERRPGSFLALVTFEAPDQSVANSRLDLGKLWFLDRIPMMSDAQVEHLQTMAPSIAQSINDSERSSRLNILFYVNKGLESRGGKGLDFSLMLCRGPNTHIGLANPGYDQRLVVEMEKDGLLYSNRCGYGWVTKLGQKYYDEAEQTGWKPPID